LKAAARLSIPSRARFAALGAAALLAVSACGGEPPAATDAGAGSAAGAAAGPASGAPVRFAAGRVSLVRDQALALAILEEVAGAAGFELVVGPVTARTISLRLDEVPLVEAIGALLEGTPFRAEYAVDPQTGAHRLARLVVGEPARSVGPGKPLAALDREARSEDAARLREERREKAEARRRLAGASATERQEREARALEQLGDPDAEQRLEAVSTLDPEGEGAARIAELAKSDPDPRVRVAAVAQLAEANSYQATTVLLDALADPSPAVLVAALEALEFSGDRSLLPRMQPFATHPDPAVREAAREAIEALR
jgi:hypothetical protein